MGEEHSKVSEESQEWRACYTKLAEQIGGSQEAPLPVPQCKPRDLSSDPASSAAEPSAPNSLGDDGSSEAAKEPPYAVEGPENGNAVRLPPSNATTPTSHSDTAPPMPAPPDRSRHTSAGDEVEQDISPQPNHGG